MAVRPEHDQVGAALPRFERNHVRGPAVAHHLAHHTSRVRLAWHRGMEPFACGTRQVVDVRPHGGWQRAVELVVSSAP